MSQPNVSPDITSPKPTQPGKTDNGGEVRSLLAASMAPAPDRQTDAARDDFTTQTLRERETARQGIQKYFELRDKWSRYIMAYVWFMLGFQLVLTLVIGFGWLDFSGYGFFINLIIGQNFAQIVGMGVIVAKFLFSDSNPS